MPTNIRGSKLGRTGVQLTMTRYDAQKLLYVLQHEDVIGDAMEFMGLKSGPVIEMIDELRGGLLEALGRKR